MVDFPRVEISGGPHGRMVEIKVDGERLKAVSAFTISGDAQDVLRMEITQIVEVDVDARLRRLPHSYRVIVPVDGLGVVSSTADSVAEALRDCARQIELQTNTTVTHYDT